jgi:molybdate transport repressor ModE-like protein
VPLGPRVPELGALELLLAIARTGSLNAAAREVGVTQQGASSRLSAMEAQTGVQLVLRTARGSSLTPAGVVVAEWAARLVDVAEQLDAGLAALRDDRRSRVRVSASLTVAEHLLPGWLVSLQTEGRRRGTPIAEVVLTATNSEHVLAQVLAGAADLGFVEAPGSLRGVRSRVVGHDELVVVVRVDHPWVRRRRPVSAVELSTTGLVSREEGSGTREALSRALTATLGTGTVQVLPALVLSTTSAVRSAVQAGAGPAVLSELSVADDLASGRLARVTVADLDLRRQLRAVWVGPPQPPAGAVRDLVTHVVSQKPKAYNRRL